MLPVQGLGAGGGQTERKSFEHPPGKLLWNYDVEGDNLTAIGSTKTSTRGAQQVGSLAVLSRVRVYKVGSGTVQELLMIALEKRVFGRRRRSGPIQPGRRWLRLRLKFGRGLMGRNEVK